MKLKIEIGDEIYYVYALESEVEITLKAFSNLFKLESNRVDSKEVFVIKEMLKPKITILYNEDFILAANIKEK